MASFISRNLTAKSTCLVVGASGVIGSALFKQLAQAGVNVYGTTHRSINETNSKQFYLNLLEPNRWQMPPIQFDVVYICAGVCRLAACEENPSLARRTNVEGTKALAEYFAQQGAFVVFLSTNQVFSGDEAFVHPLAAYNPQNEYGKQKMQAEIALKSVCENFAIVRLTKVFDSQLLLIKNWLKSLKAGESIHAFEDMKLAPVNIKQVLQILEAIGAQKKIGHYHVSGSEDVSYYSLARYLANSLQQPDELIVRQRAIDAGFKKSFLPVFTTLDCSSTMAICGEAPQHYSNVIQDCFNLN